MDKNKEILGNLKYWNILLFTSGLWKELCLKSVLQYFIFRFASVLQNVNFFHTPKKSSFLLSFLTIFSFKCQPDQLKD